MTRCDACFLHLDFLESSVVLCVFSAKLCVSFLLCCLKFLDQLVNFSAGTGVSISTLRFVLSAIVIT